MKCSQAQHDAFTVYVGDGARRDDIIEHRDTFQGDYRSNICTYRPAHT